MGKKDDLIHKLKCDLKELQDENKLMQADIDGDLVLRCVSREITAPYAGFGEEREPVAFYATYISETTRGELEITVNSPREMKNLLFIPRKVADTFFR